MPQLQQINELSNESKTKQSAVKQAFIQQHHPLSQRSVYQQQQQQLKTGSALSVSSPQLLQAASPQVSQQSSPQIDQQSLVASSLQVPKVVTPMQPANSPFMAPSPSALAAPSPHIEDTEKQSSAISSISNAGSAQGFQQTAPALNHAQSLAIGTPGISTSPLLADFSPSPAQNTVNQDGHQTVSSGFLVGDKSSTTEPPLERLIKVINSMSPKALSSAVNDIGSVVSLIDRMAGSAPGNGSRAAVGEDLVAMTKCRLQARNLMSQDGSAATKRMRRRMSSMPLSTASSGGSVTNSLQQHNNLESPEMESTATSKIKRPRLEMNHALRDEIREINHQLIDTVVDVSEDDNDAAAAAAVGRDGIVVKCSYNATALSPSMKNRYRSSQMTPISPLRLLIPENYPNSSPILIDRAPVEPCKEYEDLSSRARSNFHATVRTLPQPMSLKELAKTWDLCARSTVAEYAQQCGGGSFSSRFGAWESCASA
jgi:PAX-interacting protein 1